MSLETDGKTNAAKTTLFDSSLGKVLEELNVDPANGLSGSEAAKRLFQSGYNEVVETKANPVLRFVGKFWGISAWMLELVVVLSWYLKKYPDMVVVAGLLIVNAVLSYEEERQAERAVEALKGKLSINAKVLRDGQWTTTPARQLVPGDIIRLRAGDFAPADIKLTDGDLHIDQSSLTGESGLVTKGKADNLFSASTVQRGEATGVVLTTGAATFFGKTTQLVQFARPKLHIEEIITKVVRRLFVIVGALLLLMLAVVVYRQISVIATLPLVLVVMLSAVPVALPVMLTVATTVGAKELVSQGVLVTRLNASEDAAMVDVICVDKTGTITFNRLSVTQVLPQPAYEEAGVLKNALLASQEADQDPIDIAIIKAANARGITVGFSQVDRFIPFSPETRRTEAFVTENGSHYRVIKGAVDVVIELCGLSAKTAQAIRQTAAELANTGNKVLAIATVGDNNLFAFVGLLGLSDVPRPDSKELISQASSLGISIKMLTGDALGTAKEIARQVGIPGEMVSAQEVRKLLKTSPEKALQLIRDSGGFAEVYPEDKFMIVKALQDAGHVVGMTGDGVNDSPALKQAEVGIAVSNASDVAKEAASVVLTTEGLAGIISLIKIGRTVHRRIQIWVLNKISRTILKATFVVGSFLLTGDFLVSALAMLLLIFMTDFAKISLATDHVKWATTPTTLNIGPMTKLGTILGVTMVVEIAVLMYIGIHYFGLFPGERALNTYSFLSLFFFAIFSLLVVRQEGHFWRLRPSSMLAGVIIADVIIAVLIGVFGISGLPGIGWPILLFIIAYSLVFSLGVNDFLKVQFQNNASGTVPGRTIR